LSKLTIRIIPILFLLLLANVEQANAQGGSVYFGVGSAYDTVGTTKNSTATCPSGDLFDDFTLTCERGPVIGGTFGLFGADFMIKPHFGINGEYAFRFSQGSYLPDAGLTMRPGFYDFNAVWEPTSGSGHRVVPVFEGGVGGANVTLYESQTTCVTSICSNSSSPAGLSANHFQVHGAVGVKLYIKGGIFLKPQFDFHYVPNLTQQFGSDWVPQATLSIGYSFGER
jgi:hypothetical protein